MKVDVFFFSSISQRKLADDARALKTSSKGAQLVHSQPSCGQPPLLLFIALAFWAVLFIASSCACALFIELSWVRCIASPASSCAVYPGTKLKHCSEPSSVILLRVPCPLLAQTCSTLYLNTKIVCFCFFLWNLHFFFHPSFFIHILF